MMIHKFERFGDMITIGDHYLRMVLVDDDNNRFIIGECVDVATVYYGPYA